MFCGTTPNSFLVKNEFFFFSNCPKGGDGDAAAAAAAQNEDNESHFGIFHTKAPFSRLARLSIEPLLRPGGRRSLQ